MRSAMQRIFRQYSRFESRVLAVRGSYLNLASHCWSDESGNQSSSLILAEIDGDDHIVYEARFDEDDFNGAKNSNAATTPEGAAFAESGNTASQLMTAENSGDYDKLFNELAAPGLRVESRAGTIFPERTPAELRDDSVELFHAMVASARTWYSVVRWLSPAVPSCVRTRSNRRGGRAL